MISPKRNHNRRTRAAVAVLWLFIAIAAFGSLCLLAAPSVPLADVATAFTPLYAISGAIALLLAAAQRRWKAAVPAACAILWPAALSVPYVPVATTEASGPAVTVVTANLQGDAGDVTWLFDVVTTHNPDILFFQEYTPAAEPQLAALRDSYPHVHSHAVENVLGTAIYSRFPLTDTKTTWLAPRTYATLLATARVHDRDIRLVCFHAPPPVRADYYDARNAAFRSLPAEIALDDTAIVAGDFNATPWSPAFRQLLRRGRLADSRRGHGLFGTWPSGAGPLALPIDHVLVRGDADCAALTTQRTPSDHRAVVARLALY